MTRCELGQLALRSKRKNQIRTPATKTLKHFRALLFSRRELDQVFRMERGVDPGRSRKHRMPTPTGQQFHAVEANSARRFRFDKQNRQRAEAFQLHTAALSRG